MDFGHCIDVSPGLLMSGLCQLMIHQRCVLLQQLQRLLYRIRMFFYNLLLVEVCIYMIQLG